MERNGRMSKLMKHNASSNGYVPTPEQVDRLISLVANVTTSRQEWLRSKLQPDRRRDIYKECGFDKAPTREVYRDFFKRDPIAGRVISFMPKECWKKPPLVYEIEDGEEATAFEESWDNVGENILSHAKLKMKSHYKREKFNPLWQYMKRLDILAGAGSFGVMLLGFDDIKVRKGEPPEEQLRQPVKPKEGMKLNFVRVFPEWLVDVATRVTDVNDPRFDLPETYNITFNDPQENSSTGMTGTGPLNTIRTVHWTRVIHVPSDDLHSNEVYGPPRCESVFNNILNCFKIASADPEGYWQSCFNILSAETHPSLGGDEIEIDQTKMRNLFESMMQGLQRYGVFQGMSLKSIAPNVVDPTPHINTQIELICINKAWPVRIFKGSERGELASSMDERDHKGKVQERCEGYCSSSIAIPLIDRLIWAGVLAEPAEENGFSLEWEDSTVHTELDRATVAKTKTETIGAYVSSGADAVYPPHEFLTRIMGEDDEEAEAILDAATEHVEEKQEKMIEQSQAQIDAGVAPDPTKPAPGKGPPGAGGAKPPGGPPKAKPAFGGVRNAEGLDLVEFVENAFCATGKGGGVNPTCGKGGQQTRVTPRVNIPTPASLLKKLGDKGRKLRTKAKEAYKKLEARYGRAGATAIFLSGQAISWGAFSIGAAFGQVVWVPSAVAMAPGAAIAEVVRKVRGRRRKLATNEDFIEAEARSLVAMLESYARSLGIEDFGFETTNAFCPTGPGGGVDPTCSPGGSGNNFTSEETARGLSRLNDAPIETDPDEVTFQGQGDQIRLRNLGFKGAGGIYGGMGDEKKRAKLQVEMTLKPDQVHYSQFTVIKAAVERKLRNADDRAADFSAADKLPLVVKDGNDYHLQEGHHRAVAQALARGEMRVRVIERDRTGEKRGKESKAKYKKPDVTANAFCPTGEGGGIDPTCSPGEAGGGGSGSKTKDGKDFVKGSNPADGPKPDVTVDTSNPKTAEVMRKTFGKDINTDDLATACNALPGAKVNVKLTQAGGGVVVEVHNPNGVAKRTFYRDRDGKLVCNNDLFINHDVPGQPKTSGAEMLHSQVKSLQKIGVDRIETNAARDDNSKPPLVGYKVWPKLGYSGNIPDAAFSKLPPDIRAAMGEKPGKLLGLVGKNKGGRDIQALYAIPGGKEAWEKSGSALDMTFDVKPGSDNIKRLEAYLKNRKPKGS